MYASVMVIVVAAVLAFTALTLKPLQKKNQEIAKKKDILKAVNIESTSENAEELFDKYIVEALVVNTKGDLVSKDKSKAFNVNLKKQLKKSLDKQDLPVFIFENEKKERKVILPLLGKGMWGPIWGYVALKSDMNTVYGVTFDHKGETPGLGAEISTPKFQEQFAGKEFFKQNSEFTPLKLIKGGAKSTHEFDAVSGGTVTSKGLEAMLLDNLSKYKNYLQNNK
jgi:Na+-transporting NADH:ubiquinone oxidoreductase subunit C